MVLLDNRNRRFLYPGPLVDEVRWQADDNTLSGGSDSWDAPESMDREGEDVSR